MGYVLLTGVVALAIFSVTGSGDSGGALLSQLVESPNVFAGLVLFGIQIGVVLDSLVNW